MSQGTYEVEVPAIPRPRVLVADSDDIVLALIFHILTRQGYAVDSDTTAEAAQAQVVANAYDAILLDAKLLRGDVDSLWQRADNGRRLLILASEEVAPDVPVRAILRKPIEFGLLIETVARCVDGAD